MTLETTMATAVNLPTVTLFTAVQIVLPTVTINLLDAAGVVTFPVNGVSTTFTGRDSVFGTLASIGAVGSTMGNETPRTSITVMPPTVEAVGVLADPTVQGCSVRAYEGAFDPATGAVIGTPHQFWSGIIDVAYAITDQFSRSVEIDTVSIMAKFLQRNEGLRLNVAWQSQHFANATGLRFNVAATTNPTWGIEGVSGTGFGGAISGGGGTGGTVGGGSSGSTGGGGYGGGGSLFDTGRSIQSF